MSSRGWRLATPGSLAERAVALSAVLLIPPALRLLPLRTVLALCDRWPRVAPRRARPPVLASRVRRWLRHGAGPWRSSCLTRSAVLYAMLRQHGYEPGFRLGVAGGELRFDAHAWVTVEDRAVDQPANIADGYRLLVVHHA